MTSGQALSNDLKAPSHNISALHSDGNGKTHVGIANVIVISSANRTASSNVHAPLYNPAPSLSTVLLHDGRNYHWRLVIINNGIHEISSGNGDQSVTSRQSQRFLNPTKFRNGHAKLLSHPGVRPDATNDNLSRPDTTGGETHSPSFRQTLHKHIPSETAPLLPSKDILHGDPNVVTFDGTVHKTGIQREMAWSHPQPLVISLQQRHRKALAAASLQQVIGVGKVQTESHASGHGS
mmetsp:Transcript_17826/g.22156  ORF Transcript_17826/g.22156 Transcript_17826/m.22156 type:complete len:236 (-) Transcript_17826:932-1639(-)